MGKNKKKNKKQKAGALPEVSSVMEDINARIEWPDVRKRYILLSKQASDIADEQRMIEREIQNIRDLADIFSVTL